MGVCKYCGESAGKIWNRHGGCKKRHHLALEELVERSTSCALGGASIDDVRNEQISASQCFVTEAEIREALIEGFKQAVDITLRQSDWISEDAEHHLNSYVKNWLSQDEFNHSGAYEVVYLGVKLREIASGQMPYHLWRSIANDLPFGFQDSEECVWVFQNVRLETKSTSDLGLLALTTKSLYFSGSNERHRIPYGRIFTASRKWYGYGFSIHQGSSAKSYTLANGWFAWRLLSILAKKD